MAKNKDKAKPKQNKGQGGQMNATADNNTQNNQNGAQDGKKGGAQGNQGNNKDFYA